MLKIKCPIFFFVETAFLTMITGTAPLSSYRLWTSLAATLTTLSLSVYTKKAFICWQHKASRIGITYIWYRNISNLHIVSSKSSTSPTCPNLSSTCPDKIFMSKPSGVIGCWLIHSESGLPIGTIGFSETSVSATFHQSNTRFAGIAHAISPSNQHETTLIQTWTTKAPTATSHRRSSWGIVL